MATEAACNDMLGGLVRIRCALIACALSLTFCAVAVAATLPAAHTEYTFVFHGKHAFGVNLGVKSATRIVASHPRPPKLPSSTLLVLCPGASIYSTELQMGFPSANLKLRGRHYAFRVSYTEKQADLVTFGKTITITHESARAIVTGTVRSTKLITGTVAVTATGCSLKTSKYKATPLKPG